MVYFFDNPSPRSKSFPTRFQSSSNLSTFKNIKDFKFLTIIILLKGICKGPKINSLIKMSILTQTETVSEWLQHINKKYLVIWNILNNEEYTKFRRRVKQKHQVYF